MDTVCPICGRSPLSTVLSRAGIDLETGIRDAFVRRRLGHEARQPESMDLTAFMHGGPGRLLHCARCGTLLRDEDERARYDEDIYDPSLVDQLYPRYRLAFEEKKSVYQPLLRDGAEVLEVGSHLGAFLEAAEEWKWRLTGLDIGRSAGEFARRRGLTVRRISLDDYSPHLRRPEAVFIWNCFEQMENPSLVLGRSHSILDRHGILVVRVPNAEFYRQQFYRGRRGLRILAYNNLLGFPYLHGYTPEVLRGLLRNHGFQPIALHESSLLTPPYPDFSRQIRREWSSVRREGETSGGPWIEIVGRRC